MNAIEPQPPKITVNPATQKNTPSQVAKGTTFSNTVNTRSKVKLATRAAEPNTSEPPTVIAAKSNIMPRHILSYSVTVLILISFTF